MNRHALEVLQFPQTLDLVAGHASSPLGADRVRALTPSDARVWIDTELDRVDELMRTIRRGPGWSMPRIPDCLPALRRLAAQGSVLDAPELRDLADLCDSAGTARTLLRANAERMPTIAAIDARLHPLEPVVRQIRHAVDADGTVRDTASKDLARIRREMRGARNRIVDKLEQYAASLPARFRVADASVTLRDGRYVIPVRREGRGEVGGLVHDESATGQTLFVEPPVAIELMNRLRELEIAETREVQRILRELSESIRPRHDELRESLDALVDIDTVHARANYALRNDGERPVMASAGGDYEVVNGRHPQLLAGAGDTSPSPSVVVPFDLRLDPGERTLLISGPNTGGKTVLLKAVGLVSALAQAGIIPPVGPGTKLPVFRDIFADIGDEQSIEASLSTFSAHLRNIGEILARATAGSLVLLDELGSGTDPLEGAALGGAVIEALTRRGATSVATTHLGALKELAGEVPGVVNASLQFDADRLAPTYHLIKGIPGRSYGLRIARRLGLPDEVLRRAEERVPQVERDVNALLESLEARDVELARRETEATATLEAARDRAHRLAEREDGLRRREVAFEREARQDTRRYLLEARHEVERAIRDLRKAAASEAEEAAREARQQVERLAESHRERLAELDAPTVPGGSLSGPAAVPAPGALVVVHPMGGRVGRVIEQRDGDFLVALGAVKMSFPATQLSVAPASAVPSAPVLRGDLPDEEVPTEIDLRGLRAIEVEEVVLQALDAAIRADLRSLRVIHGKGTGALRERVTEMLRKDTRVRGFRTAAWNEGGAGVTVVDL
jgi:DNA mismatch repair protein MutS2